MRPDLHHAIRDVYRGVIADGGTAQDAFDAAWKLVAANEPSLAPPEARRLAAIMLCWDPGSPVVSHWLQDRADADQEIPLGAKPCPALPS